MVVSLPLMRKTFIEAVQPATILTACVESLPLMRKTFIEAPRLCRLAGREPGLFRLCGRLSLRRRQRPARRSGDVGVSSAYAEDFH